MIASIQVKYDSALHTWTLQRKDNKGNQIGDAEFHDRLQEIAHAADSHKARHPRASLVVPKLISRYMRAA